jgi:hypothetical protein
MVVSFEAASARFFQSLANVVNGWRGSWDHRVGTAKGFATPQSLELALALEVGKMESHLPGLPSTRRGWEAFSIVNVMWEVLGCKDSRQCHHDKFDIGDRHASPFSLFLGILHHDNNWGMPSAYM